MMMMMGEGSAHAPPWQCTAPSGAGDDVAPPPYHALSALRRYLPSNEPPSGDAQDGGDEDDDAAATADAYACDEFRMYEFKVRRCTRGRSHDWTDCPFAHPGEKARRRDPRRYCYSGAACPDFRKGGACKRGDACEHAHGVFECWLHPARYRTQPCKDGTACRRRVCFFAHTPAQLRSPPCSPRAASASSGSSPPLADSYDGSPLRRQAFESYLGGGSGKSHLVQAQLSSSPTSTLLSPPRSPPSDSSPPMSPDAALRAASWPVSDVLASLRQLRLGGPQSSPRPAGCFLAAGYSTAFGSPKSPAAGIYSLPSTPTRPSSSLVTVTAPSGATVSVEPIDLGLIVEEEPPVERVESGRALRAKVFERLSKEAAVCNDTTEVPAAAAPDVGWVSDLIN